MKVHSSRDGTVTKYIHRDGSETAIKLNNSCDGTFEFNDKYTIFISCSVGCPVGCKFCHLTTNKFHYRKLSVMEIFSNVIDAIEHQILENPSVQDKYIKLSWMGMGDALIDHVTMFNVTELLIELIHERDYAKGLDGVDISTTFPKSVYIDGLINGLLHFNNIASKYNTRRNPRKEHLPILRIFYSLHSSDPYVRRDMIPNSCTSDYTIEMLTRLPPEYVTIALHHMILDGINDNKEDVDKVIEIANTDYMELRILRYNDSPNSNYKESPNFDKWMDYIKNSVNNLKIQYSSGSDVKASCGQFLMNK